MDQVLANHLSFSVESGDVLLSSSIYPSLAVFTVHHRKERTEHPSHSVLHLWFNHCGNFFVGLLSAYLSWSFCVPLFFPACLLLSYLVRAVLGKTDLTVAKLSAK